MIPKIIHYCWLSNDPFPSDIRRCIDSWKKYLPDYELRLWNMDSFGSECPVWVNEAFAHRKYAFAADYVRAYALYNYGGIYLDSDVEVLKSFDELLGLPYILGRETYGGSVEAACIGAEKYHPLYKDLLAYYDGRHFEKPDGNLDQLPLPSIMDKIIANKYRRVDINDIEAFDYSADTLSVFSQDFFSPKNLKNQQISITKNTIAIHHFGGSWMPWYKKWTHPIQKLLGPKVTYVIQSVKAKMLKK